MYYVIADIYYIVTRKFTNSTSLKLDMNTIYETGAKAV